MLLSRSAEFLRGNIRLPTASTYIAGKHTLQFGFDFSRAWDSDNNFGGADPNADVQFGSFLGSLRILRFAKFRVG